MIRLVTAIALLVAGCANLPPNRPTTVPEQRQVAAAIEAWRAAGRPADDFIEIRPDRVHVAVLDPQTTLDRCLACYPGPECRNVHSCALTPNRTLLERPSLLVVMSSAIPADRRPAIVIHETLHVLRALVIRKMLARGEELPQWAVQGENGAAGDLPDRPHRDTELWTTIEQDAVRRAGGAR